MTNPFVADVIYRIAPPVTNEDLNRLFSAAWRNHSKKDFATQLRHSLIYVCAYENMALVGFVNVAWDGGSHAFLLDTTVHPDRQRHGIGQELVEQAVQAIAGHGIEWLHVDYEAHLESFYRRCGFVPTLAGLIHLQGEE
jgi:GNAT superfamily N-acetyltransferase